MKTTIIFLILGYCYQIFACDEVQVTSSSHRRGNVAQNAYDNDESTRWETSGSGEYLDFEFCEFKKLNSIRLLFPRGNKIGYYYSIAISLDGKSFSQVLAKTKSQRTRSYIEHSLAGIEAKFLKIITYGTDQSRRSDTNRISEVEFSFRPTDTTSPPSGTDTTAPQVSNGSPSGALSSGTQQVEISVSTDENAQCRYSSNLGNSYESMQNFSQTGETVHQSSVSSLQDGQSYEYAVLCKDSSGNISDEYLIRFSIDQQQSTSLPPDLYRNFEGTFIPMDARTSSELSQNNGCFGDDYDDYFYRDTCVSNIDNELTDSASEKSNVVARSGSNSVRFFLRPSDPNNWPSGEPTHRVELRPKDSAANYLPALGTENWYGFSTYFPSDFKFVPNIDKLPELHRFIIVQFQHGGPGSPTLSLQVIGDNLVLRQKMGYADTDGVTSTDYIVDKINRGSWSDIVLRVVWQNNGTGLFQLWQNGSLKVQKFSTDTSYKDSQAGSRIKFGMYYWRWKEKSIVQESFNMGITEREIFFDEMRIYQGSNGYDRVVPRD
ncbi:MAG: heparin lyase I family protein [Halobacteriovoraceae bacterium]|nr:heparin lyase I family protein [Halobacteriovoraceae bacterium]MCB9095305.1 heparin lyase I family protein [Halobacteriovoraceae bacterium]